MMISSHWMIGKRKEVKMKLFICTKTIKFQTNAQSKDWAFLIVFSL